MNKVRMCGFTLGAYGKVICVYECKDCGHRSIMLPWACNCEKRLLERKDVGKTIQSLLSYKKKQ